MRLGRVGNRDSESIFDANLIAGNREGDEEHFVGKMGGFLWLNNTMEDCQNYLSLRSGGYAYIVYSYFLQHGAKAVLGWDRNHVHSRQLFSRQWKKHTRSWQSKTHRYTSND